jgi:dTDP-4-amino-4,6-dideoxygalactose transaminase
MPSQTDRAASTVTDINWPAWPSHSEEEIAAAIDVLRSGRVNYWARGQGWAFEKEFAEYFGTSRAIALANGSVAIGLALKALDIGPGDDVIVTPRTFMASASEIVLTGARPVFADVDRDSQNITVESIASALTPATRAILAVHLAGWPCDMPAIARFAAERGIAVIEDCAQAHGAAIADQRVGSWGKAGCFSFCTDKIMTTGGEGGMLTTSDEDVWEKAWSFKDHGKNFVSATAPATEPKYRWVIDSFGTNWRLTEMQSAIGRIQLARLDDWVARRRANATTLNERLADLPGIRLTHPPAGVFHSYYKYYCFVRPEAFRPDWSRDRILRELVAAGVRAGSGSCPEIYQEAAFAEHDSKPEHSLPVAKELGQTSIMLEVHPTLGADHMHQVADGLAAILDQACA